MSLWLAERPIVVEDQPAEITIPPGTLSGPPRDDFAPAQPDLSRYREAVGELVAQVRLCGPDDTSAAERIVARRVADEPLAAFLSATPAGRDAAIAQLLFEIRNYERGPRNLAASVAGQVRIAMLTQIDAIWWGRAPGYRTDSELLGAAELVDLDELEAEGVLRFCYRNQATTLASRAARAAQRRALPGHSPRTAGMRMARARPHVVAWLNQLATDFAALAPEGTPPLWVTSLTRSVSYQRHLKSLGYSAPLPSAHCVGYAADIEVAWYRRFHAHRILRGLLLDHQRADEVNVIDEGQAWHVCLGPRLAHGQS